MRIDDIYDADKRSTNKLVHKMAESWVVSAESLAKYQANQKRIADRRVTRRWRNWLGIRR